MGHYSVTIHGANVRLPANNKQATALLMTATISPPAGAVARSDSAIRLQDYMECLGFYLQAPSIHRILFVDNSASDLSTIERLVRSIRHDKVVELISFDGNDYPLAYGKAYGEFRLIDFGLMHTQILDENDTFWKVTGRLRFLNLATMIASVSCQYDVLCDLHNFPLVGTGKLFNNRWMDLRVFSCSIRGYRTLLQGKYKNLGSRMNQNTLYDVVRSANNGLRVIPRFPIQPILGGVSGRHNRDYLKGFQRVKTVLRIGARKIAPFVWI